ncbi:MAG: GNAT family N-acetyltransferase [Micrococcales bacterium]|nr:GNAT family N-acetyltransferase [Micrococcales bacterium]MCL2668121.1 GNAT family N-acetyltransferase [Micrococcales bacterium]
MEQLEPPTLTGEMLVLRPLEAQDIDAILEISNDPEAQRLGAHQTLTRGDAVRLIADSSECTDRLALAVRTVVRDTLVGEIVLDHIDWESSSAWLSIEMRPAYRGRGYDTEAVVLMLELAFDEFRLHRIGVNLPAVNYRARSMYESLGFRMDGRLRDAHRDGDLWCDAILLSLLADEFHVSYPIRSPDHTR